MVQVRLKRRHLTEGTESPLKEWFLIATNDSPWMDTMGFEAWANQSGYPTAVCTWLSKQMSRIAMEVCSKLSDSRLLHSSIMITQRQSERNLCIQENVHLKGHTADISFNQFSRLIRLRIPEVQKTAGLQVCSILK